MPVVSNVPALVYYIEQIYGGKFYTRPRTITLNAGITKVVDNNYERVALIIVLLSTSTVYFAPNQNVSDTGGIELTATGSTITTNAHDDLTLPGDTWYAYSATGGEKVYTIEIIRYTEGNNT